jgi:hypothetical protein
MTVHAQTDDFDIGKAIFDQLKDLPPERQQRVLRWVAEGLGVPQSAIAAQSPQVAGAHNPPQVPVTGHLGGASGTDIKTFIANKAPKSDQQFAAAVAYYYRFEAPPAERRESIDGDLLQEATRLAGRSRLNSPRATLNNAKGSGYLDSTTPGVFTINSVGENLVAMTLPGGGEAAARQAKKPKAKKKKAKKR